MIRLLLAALALACLSLPVDARPVHCPKTRWCGCWMAHHLGLRDRSLWLARNWATVGTKASAPAAGVVVVWRHHVGIVTGRDYKGNWIVKSGNDGRQVRERPRSLADAIAFRWP